MNLSSYFLYVTALLLASSFHAQAQDPCSYDAVAYKMFQYLQQDPALVNNPQAIWAAMDRFESNPNVFIGACKAHQNSQAVQPLSTQQKGVKSNALDINVLTPADISALEAKANMGNAGAQNILKSYKEDQQAKDEAKKEAADDEEARDGILVESVMNHPGDCPCPWSVDGTGKQCGESSQYSYTKGQGIVCYPNDITPKMVTEYKKKYPPGNPCLNNPDESCKILRNMSILD